MSYFRLLKAYADAIEALKMDPYFQDAMLLKSKTLVSLGLYSHARKSIQSYGGYAMERTTGAIILRSIAGKVSATFRSEDNLLHILRPTIR